jgi:hypothetical protein
LFPLLHARFDHRTSTTKSACVCEDLLMNGHRFWRPVENGSNRSVCNPFAAPTIDASASTIVRQYSECAASRAGTSPLRQILPRMSSDVSDGLSRPTLRRPHHLSWLEKT